MAKTGYDPDFIELMCKCGYDIELECSFDKLSNSEKQVIRVASCAWVHQEININMIEERVQRFKTAFENL